MILSDEELAAYYGSHIIAAKCLLDGREVHLRRMIFNFRISVVAQGDPYFYEDEWCFNDPKAGALAFMTRTEGDEPPGWNKHPRTGRWREDGTSETERCQW